MKLSFNSEDFVDIPSIEDFKLLLEKFGNEDLAKFSYDEIANKYYDLFKILPTISMLTLSEKFNDLHLYRARLAKTIGENEDTDLVQTYSYPPTSFVRYNGRANIKHKSVFYCSDHYIASILECNPEIDDIGYLSLWHPQTKRDLKFTIYLPVGLNSNNIFSTIASNSLAYFTDVHKDEVLGKHLIELRKFIANKFVNELPPYPISSFIANESLYRDFNNDYIMYPSSKTFAYYNNYAFHPNSVNENLRLKKILKFKVLSNQVPVNIGFMAVGIVDGIQIKWEIPTDENVADFRFDNYKFYST